MSAPSPCNQAELHKLLADEIDSNVEDSVLVHIAACSECQSRLHDMAAGADQWNEARDILSTLPVEKMGDTEEEWSKSWGHYATVARPSTWSHSMIRQVLGPPSHPELLGRIGRYDVERLLGVGGMGVVFKGFDGELNRPVAIKVLAPFLSGSGAARKRFAREARAAAAVVHEHVVAIHNVETDGESPFLVMQFVAGESLQQRLDREGNLSLAEVLRIGAQAASGLAAAHAQGLVHRDVKPSNILLEQGVERTLLSDFGLARASDDASLTHTGFHPGTPQYMSPEQARGDAVDTRSDLFSLGSVLYTACAGRPPFRAETSYGILRRITDSEPRPLREINPDVPVWLEGIIARLHAKAPGDRFQSADEVAQVLRGCLAHVQQPNQVELPEVCQPRGGRVSTFRMVTLIASTLLLLLVFLGMLVYPGPDGVGTTDNNPPQNVSPATPTELDWDATAQELQEFEQEFEPFESQFDVLWASPPEGSPSP
ncbi:MAG: serine/threonine protein kinase [Planctomycetaceae bacterium]|nr:serine/threonine protein kinase [Planctomycetaceae bacterium]